MPPKQRKSGTNSPSTSPQLPRSSSSTLKDGGLKQHQQLPAALHSNVPEPNSKSGGTSHLNSSPLHNNEKISSGVSSASSSSTLQPRGVANNRTWNSPTPTPSEQERARRAHPGADPTLFSRVPEPSPRLHHHRRRRTSLTGWIARLLLIYISYTTIWVCPSLPAKESNAVCENLHKAQAWLQPHAQPYYDQAYEVYKVHGEPLVDNYGRPLVQKSQMYYSDYAQPAFVSTRKAMTENYQKHAQPHVEKAYKKVYTKDMQKKVAEYQKVLNGYQVQAQTQLDQARKQVELAQVKAQALHKAHVEPVLKKLEPHAKMAWKHTSANAKKAYAAATVMYVQHVNPFAQQTWTVVRDATQRTGQDLYKRANNFIRDSEYFKAKSLNDLGQQAKKEATLLMTKAGNLPKQARVKAEQARDWVGEAATKLDEKTGASEKVQYAKNNAGQMASDQAEHIKKVAADSAHQASEAAGHLSDRVKKTVVERARAAQEAVVKKARDSKEYVAENAGDSAMYMKDKVVDGAQSAQDAASIRAEQIKETIREAAGKQASYVKEHVAEGVYAAHEAASHHAQVAKDYVAVKAGESAEQVKAAAQDAANVAARQANEAKEAAARKLRETQEAAAIKLRETKEALAKKAKETREQAEKEAIAVKNQAEEVAKKHAADANIKMQEAGKVAQDHALAAAQLANVKAHEGIKAAQDQAADAHKVVRQKAADAYDSASENVAWVKNKAAEQGQQQAETIQSAFIVNQEGIASKVQQVKEKVQEAAPEASLAAKTALTAMLSSIETVFGSSRHVAETETKNLWNKLQEALDEHKQKSLKTAAELKALQEKEFKAFEQYAANVRNGAVDQNEDAATKLQELGSRAGQTISTLGKRAEEEKGRGQEQIKVLTDNVNVYISGLKDFLLDKIEVSKKSVQDEIKKHSGSEGDESVKSKVNAMIEASMKQLKDTDREAQSKASGILREVQDIVQSYESTSRDYIGRTRALAQETRQSLEEKIAEAKAKVHSTADNDSSQEQQQDVQESWNNPNPEIRVANEEPSSGHRQRT